VEKKLVKKRLSVLADNSGLAMSSAQQRLGEIQQLTFMATLFNLMARPSTRHFNQNDKNDPHDELSRQDELQLS